MRSASVDLPWSMWAMMQKFRICAGAVNVLSAKLLMGISWSGRDRVSSQGIDSGPRCDTIGRAAALAMLGGYGVAVEGVPEVRGEPGVQRGPEAHPPAARPRARSSSRASRSVWTHSRPSASAVAGRSHQRTTGDQRQRAHRAPGPHASLRPRPGRSGRSRRDRLDLGGLRGRPDPRQGPPGAGGGSRPPHAARPHAVQPGPPRRRRPTGSGSAAAAGTTTAGPAGCGWTGCSRCPRTASAARAPSSTRDHVRDRRDAAAGRLLLELSSFYPPRACVSVGNTPRLCRSPRTLVGHRDAHPSVTDSAGGFRHIGYRTGPPPGSAISPVTSKPNRW